MADESKSPSVETADPTTNEVTASVADVSYNQGDTVDTTASKDDVRTVTASNGDRPGDLPADTASGGDRPQTTQTSVDDDDLDDLLDSALGDFDKTVPAAASNTQTTGIHGNTKPGGFPMPELPTPGGAGGDQDALFNQIFNGEMNAGGFEDAMKAFLSEDPTMQDQLNQLLRAAEGVDESSSSQQEFKSTLEQTLGSMMNNSAELQGDLSDEDLIRTMSGLGLGGMPGAAGPGAAMPDFGLGDLPAEGATDGFMMNMMQCLFSKDVLYPTLKEISQKYPDWLEKNKGSLDSAEFTRYSQQHSTVSAICSQFEAEEESDSDDKKKENFQKIFNLLQEMQQYGQPPPEISGPMAPGLEFDSQGNPKLPGMSEQCLLM